MTKPSIGPSQTRSAVAIVLTDVKALWLFTVALAGGYSTKIDFKFGELGDIADAVNPGPLFPPFSSNLIFIRAICHKDYISEVPGVWLIKNPLLLKIYAGVAYRDTCFVVELTVDFDAFTL